MAAKLILSIDGVVINEYPINKERITIGRKPHNDIVIDNLAVSGEHAAIITILNDSFLEDMDSTNGLEVNGVPAKKHFMQNNDMIEIGKYKLKYINDQITQTDPAEFEKTMVLRAPVKPVAPAGNPAEPGGFTDTQINANKAADTGMPEKSATMVNQAAVSVAAPKPQAAAVQILTGPNAGKELDLVKNLTTFGKPGVQVAVLTRRPHGFFITHIEGASFPSVNGRVLGEKPQQLSDHDVIELAGVKMEFYLKG